jgi:hypothetical protein
LHSVTEYLKQRNIFPQFITDTEVSALMFDLLSRTYKYPVSISLKPWRPPPNWTLPLPPEKQTVYRAIQASHIHGSLDGPGFHHCPKSFKRPAIRVDGKPIRPY